MCQEKIKVSPLGLRVVFCVFIYSFICLLYIHLFIIFISEIHSYFSKALSHYNVLANVCRRMKYISSTLAYVEI